MKVYISDRQLQFFKYIFLKINNKIFIYYYKISDNSLERLERLERFERLERQNEKILVKLNTLISKQKSLEEKFEEMKELINNNNNNNNKELDNAFITV